MALKTYKHSIPQSTYICSKGLTHRFNGAGLLATDDAALQAELDAAIKSGAPITAGAASVAAPAQPSAATVDAVKLK